VTTDPDLVAQISHLAAVLNYPAAIIYVRDADGRYVWVSDSFGDLLPFTREQVLGKTNRDLFGDAAANWEIADAFARVSLDFVTTPEDLYDKRTKKWRKFLSTKLTVKYRGVPYLVGISVEIKGANAERYERIVGRLRNEIMSLMGTPDDS